MHPSLSLTLAMFLLPAVAAGQVSEQAQGRGWSVGTGTDNDVVTTYARMEAHPFMSPAQLEISCTNSEALTVQVQWPEARWPRSDTDVNVAHRMRIGLFRTLTWTGAGDTMRVQEADQHDFLFDLMLAYTLTVVLSGFETSAIFELGTGVRAAIQPVLDACEVELG